MTEPLFPHPSALEAAPDFVLARFGGVRPPAPDWYEALRRETPEQLCATVDGARIEVLAWGDRSRPGILLAHGSRAHARWWGPVAPLLARHFRVASLSFSGMGGSDWRDRYSTRQHARELFAAMEVAGLSGRSRRPVILAHSFGGMAAASAARQRGGELAGVAFIDSYISPPEMRIRGGPAERKPRHYPTLTEALARFRLSPSQPNDAPYIIDDVARAGLVEEQGNWRWRFDPHLMRKLELEDPWALVCDPPCPIGFVYGERSPLAPWQLITAQRAATPPGTPSIGIPDASHHIMFDQPHALVLALRTLAETWLPAD